MWLMWACTVCLKHKSSEPQREKSYLLTCAHGRLKSACSNINLCCLHEEVLYPWLSKILTVKILIRLHECAGWSESLRGTHVQGYIFSYCGTFYLCSVFLFRLHWWCNSSRLRWHPKCPEPLRQSNRSPTACRLWRSTWPITHIPKTRVWDPGLPSLQKIVILKRICVHTQHVYGTWHGEHWLCLQTAKPTLACALVHSRCSDTECWSNVQCLKLCPWSDPTGFNDRW